MTAGLEDIEVMTSPLRFYIGAVPPSLTHYWHQGQGHRRYVSKAGQAFRLEFFAALRGACGHESTPRFAGPVAVTVGIRGLLYADGSVPPIGSPLRPDLDNLLKSLLDCLEHFGVLENDNQVDRLLVEREPPDDTKRTTVLVEELR